MFFCNKELLPNWMIETDWISEFEYEIGFFNGIWMFFKAKMLGIRAIFTRYPLLRGMVSYSIIWPTSAFIQQKIAGTSWNDIDWAKCARFSFYGGLYVAPTLYTWIRISSILFPKANLRSAVFKVWKHLKISNDIFLRIIISFNFGTNFHFNDVWIGFTGANILYSGCDDKLLLPDDFTWGSRYQWWSWWSEKEILADVQSEFQEFNCIIFPVNN